MVADDNDWLLSTLRDLGRLAKDGGSLELLHAFEDILRAASSEMNFVTLQAPESRAQIPESVARILCARRVGKQAEDFK